MPICPFCNQESKKRKNGKCPSCGKTVYLFRQGKKTLWIGEERVTTSLLEDFEKRLSERLKVSFKFEGNERKRQLAMIKTLLSKCKNIPRLAHLVIECSFVERVPRNIETILYNFSYLYALAQKKYNLEREEDEINAKRAEDTPDLEEYYAL